MFSSTHFEDVLMLYCTWIYGSVFWPNVHPRRCFLPLVHPVKALPIHLHLPSVCCCGNTSNFYHWSSLFLSLGLTSLRIHFVQKYEITTHGMIWYPCVLGHQSSDSKKLQISRNRTLCASTTNVLRIHVTIYIWSTSFDADPLTNIYDTFYGSQKLMLLSTLYY